MLWAIADAICGTVSPVEVVIRIRNVGIVRVVRVVRVVSPKKTFVLSLKLFVL